MDYDRISRAYLAMRTKKSELKREYEAAVGRIDDQMQTLENALLGSLKRTNTKSIRTASATVYTEEVMQVQCTDWPAYHAFLIESGELEGLEKRVGRKYVETYASENKGELPPGIVARREHVVRVRVASDSGDSSDA